jgi:hypothetical protein
MYVNLGLHGGIHVFVPFSFHTCPVSIPTTTTMPPLGKIICPFSSTPTTGEDRWTQADYSQCPIALQYDWHVTL